MRIQAGAYAAEIRPEAGGLLHRLTVEHGGGVVDLVHAPAGAEPSTASPNLFGLWPLVPFANRAFGGRVEADGIAFQVALNDPGGGAAIHGFGWQANWRTIEAGPAHVLLEHRRDDGPDPYRYVAQQRFTLSEAGLRVDLSVVNTGARPLPFGLGLHPWFPRDPDTRLTLRAGGALILGPGYRATGHGPVPGELDFGSGARVHRGRELVASYTGWDGTARLDYPARGFAIRISADPDLSAPLLWAPPDADFVCLEPQTHAIGAPSEAAARAVTPLRVLAPGESWAVSMTIAMVSIAGA
ncbi:aldose 1-epimerase [Prosthecodimorpha staleyi]|uniref:Aldose 1-epimerase n=1 Tax=Prosthecodimorpha staleyi TaxID=2840188 RepID=A0A947D3J1_9HYPH|nr:aldose 1-epimerase [Prosthecodimorpha staleyi]MBT9290355.1 aldose 1-epimerase [Prosthecodimorpha staleyi]